MKPLHTSLSYRFRNLYLIQLSAMYRRASKNPPSPAEETFNQLFSRVSYLFDLIGMNALDPGFAPNRRTVVTWATLLFAAVEISFFLWKLRSDMVEFMVIAPYATVSIQGLHMMIMALVKQSSYRAMHAQSREIFGTLYESNSNWPIMAGPLKIGKFLQDLLTILYSVCLGSVMVMPLVVWGFSGQKFLVMFYRLPGVDEYSTEGFLATFALHTAMILVSYCGFLGIDSLFLAWIVPFVAYVDAMGNEIEELNQLLELEESQLIHSKLKRVMKLHQLLIQFILSLEDIYSLVILVKVGSIIFGIICSILVLFKSQDPLAFVFTVILSEQLAQYCLLGATITVKNEHLINHLYDIKWYRLPNHQAKQLTLILVRAQNAPTLTVGKLAAIDMKYYGQIIHRIYSLVMMVATFLE